MKAAALQTLASMDVEQNLASAERLVAQAAEQGAMLAVLPEYFCLMGRTDRDKLQVAEDDGHGPIQDALSSMAARHQMWLVGGTLPIKTDMPDRVRNACCVVAPDGTHAARYDKVHLFRYANAHESYDEGRTLEAGSAPVAFTATMDDESWRVGLSICYDLRFPELYRALSRQQPCDIVTVPSAFTHTTGLAHWHVLLRARAIENQCYVIAAAQGGLHQNGRRTFGHSLIVDPWGDVLAERHDDGEGVVVAELELSRIARVRAQMPAWSHRRLP